MNFDFKDVGQFIKDFFETLDNSIDERKHFKSKKLDLEIPVIVRGNKVRVLNSKKVGNGIIIKIKFSDIEIHEKVLIQVVKDDKRNGSVNL